MILGARRNGGRGHKPPGGVGGVRYKTCSSRAGLLVAVSSHKSDCSLAFFGPSIGPQVPVLQGHTKLARKKHTIALDN